MPSFLASFKPKTREAVIVWPGSRKLTHTDGLNLENITRMSNTGILFDSLPLRNKEQLKETEDKSALR